MWATVLLVPVGYVLGMFPSAVLVARARGVDITKQGSGNPGASNVIRVLGWKAGAVVMLADFAKGAAAAGIGLAAGGRIGAYVVGIAAVIGHTYPLGRKGGKGVAAAGGMVFVLFPLVALGLAVVWVVVAKVAHKASLASLVVIVAFPSIVAIAGYDGWEIAVLATIAVLLVVRHAANIRRLVTHKEHDLTAH
jgi:glycerol-3-phosphate acyltransferase PlsY